MGSFLHQVLLDLGAYGRGDLVDVSVQGLPDFRGWVVKQAAGCASGDQFAEGHAFDEVWDCFVEVGTWGVVTVFDEDAQSVELQVACAGGDDC
nr:hypothetical protein D3W47_16815 [Deinococcus sp. RM]